MLCGRPVATPRPTRFYGRKELDPIRAIRDLSTILEEVTKHLDGTSKEVIMTGRSTPAPTATTPAPNG